MTDAPERTMLTDDSESPYERGLLVSHCSDDSGLPDVGLSVGLGDGLMLYAGDRPGRGGWAIAIYPMQGDTIHIAEGIEPEAGIRMIEAVAVAIARADDATRAALGDVARLREALEPFARVGRNSPPSTDTVQLGIEHFRRAAASADGGEHTATEP